MLLAAWIWALLAPGSSATAQTSLAAHVPSTAVLKATPSTAYTTVVRDGYARSGDAPPLTYTASSSPCSLNGGLGDGGSQAPSADGKCWLWNPPASGVTPQEFGAKGDGSTDDTHAVQDAIDAVEAAGIPLRFDQAHLYFISSTLDVAAPIDIEGQEHHGFWLSQAADAPPHRQCASGLTAVKGRTPADFTILSISAAYGIIRGLCIQAGPTGSTAGVNATAGAAMRFAPRDAKHYMTGWVIEDDTIYNPYDGMTFDGAGPSTACCGAGTTADGMHIRSNTIISPAHIGISVGRNTVGSATAGLTFIDNVIGCISDQSRRTGIGFDLFDGGISYDGTNNGPEGCNVGFAITPGYVTGSGPQNAQAVLRGVLGDQSATHDFLIQPSVTGANGGVVDFVQVDSGWAGATANVNSILINCPKYSSCQEITFSNLVAHGGAGQAQPIMDVEAAALYDFSLIGSNICQFGRPGSGSTALGLHVLSSVSGRFVITGNRLGAGCPGAADAIGVALSITPGDEGNVMITNNDLSAVFDASGVPIRYSPNATDRVMISNNMGVDGNGNCPNYAAAASMSLDNADSRVCISGTATISSLAHPWAGRTVTVLALRDFGWTTGGSPGFCAAGRLAAGQVATWIWPLHGACWSAR